MRVIEGYTDHTVKRQCHVLIEGHFQSRGRYGFPSGTIKEPWTKNTGDALLETKSRST